MESFKKEVVVETRLDMLVAKARGHVMTPTEMEEQRQSFAYGNTAIENPRITRTVVEKAAAHLKTTEGVTNAS